MYRVYIADLESYNNGELEGIWIKLPMEYEELKEIIKYNEYAIHDYELPFYISEYQNIYVLNSLLNFAEENNIPGEGLRHIDRIDNIFNFDHTEIRNIWYNTGTINALTRKDFAQEYIELLYQEVMEQLPWEVSGSINYEIVYDKLEMTMLITESREEDLFYYTLK